MLDKLGERVWARYRLLIQQALRDQCSTVITARDDIGGDVLF